MLNARRDVCPESSLQLGRQVLERMKDENGTDDAEEIARMCGEGADIDVKDDSEGRSIEPYNGYPQIMGRTALHWAALRSKTKSLKVLIDCGFDMEVGDSWGNTALLLAIFEGSVEDVKLLIESGADINAKGDIYDFTGITVLMAAAHSFKDGPAKIQFLVDCGANVDEKDDSEETALYHAFDEVGERPENVAALLKLKADINVQNIGGWTPLLSAIIYDAYASAKLLIDSGPDLDLENCEGYTALDLCEDIINFRNRNPMEEVLAMLRRAGAESGSAFESESESEIESENESESDPNEL